MISSQSFEDLRCRFLSILRQMLVVLALVLTHGLIMLRVCVVGGGDLERLMFLQGHW